MCARILLACFSTIAWLTYPFDRSCMAAEQVESDRTPITGADKSGKPAGGPRLDYLPDVYIELKIAPEKRSSVRQRLAEQTTRVRSLGLSLRNGQLNLRDFGRALVQLGTRTDRALEQILGVEKLREWRRYRKAHERSTRAKRRGRNQDFCSTLQSLFRSSWIWEITSHEQVDFWIHGFAANCLKDDDK